MISKTDGPKSLLEESEALRRNLAETAVSEIKIDPRYLVLRETVKDYRGLAKAVDSLLFELNHPFRNWRVIIPELRSFALKNLGFYGRHKKGPQAVELILGVFLEAASEARRTEIQSQALESMLSYMEKVVQTCLDGSSDDYGKVLSKTFENLKALPPKQKGILARNYHPMKRIAAELLSRRPMGFDFRAMNHVLTELLRINYEEWLKEADPIQWFVEEFGHLPPHGSLRENLEELSHRNLIQLMRRLDSRDGNREETEITRELLSLPGHLDLVRKYKELPEEAARMMVSSPQAVADPLRDGRILVLFKIMETSRLAEIHEETLREIQRALTGMIRSEPAERLESLLVKTFWLLKENVVNYPRTALQCIHAIGQEVFQKGQSRLVEVFLEEVVRFGFQPPDVRGVDTEWQWLCNPNHLLNIRIWLDLICLQPKWCTTLLSALIINLKLAGTCIRDTDLFQKDISKLLRSDIAPLYNLVKQLTKLIPAFFNEIGAEGLLRDVSTEVDEIHRRRDPIIHFLRKQSHVESSNLIVEFIEEIFNFWNTLDKKCLRNFLPEETLAQVDENSTLVLEPHRIVRALFQEHSLSGAKGLLSLREEEVEGTISSVEGVSEEERKRVLLLFRMYRLVYQKYYLGYQEIRYHLSQAKAHGFSGLDRLEEVLERDDPEECLEAILDYLEKLKEIILSPETFEVTEDIYHKRHIAADIPSMYGRYHEKKFDALGLSFRLENLANVYFERLIESVNLSFITRAVFFKIVKCIRLFMRAMQIDGISSQRLEAYMDLLEKSLEMRRFTYTQYLDILRGLSEGVKDILNVYYTDVHKDTLEVVIRSLGPRHILPKYLGHGNDGDEDALVHRISEQFFRDLVSSTFGLQYLDNFLTRIHQTLALQKETLSEADLDLLMTYDPERVLSHIHAPRKLTRDPIHLGSKGYNLVLLAEAGVRVPPGFIVTSEVARCHRIVLNFPQAHEDFVSRIRDGIRRLEELTGKRFGDPSCPLLVSVRSGSTISMPGMMDTLLNVGINEEIAQGMANSTRNPWFAWDNYRRFLQSWGMSFGMEREVFNEIMREWKARFGVEKKRQFTGEQMQKMAMAYRRALEESGIAVEEDPWRQLETAIHRVIYSWNSPKAKDYREIMGISDDWGTAVIVQAMVFGNLGPKAGSGVLFTANPTRRMRRVVLWGDYTPMNQGEDIVAGLVTTFPISNEQREESGRGGEVTLEDEFPEIYRALLDLAKMLVYEKGWNPQEIEFTFEGPEASQLYILQTRDMVTMRRRETVPVFVSSPELHEHYLSKGTGVSGGALCGRVVFTLEDIRKWRTLEPQTPLILVRSDTVPDDIKEISLTDGLLTAKGGQTSHAAIVALRLGKTCVVGTGGLTVLSEKGPCRIHGVTVKEGDFLSLDGRSGSVYLGRHPIEQKAVTSTSTNIEMGR